MLWAIAVLLELARVVQAVLRELSAQPKVGGQDGCEPLRGVQRAQDVPFKLVNKRNPPDCDVQLKVSLRQDQIYLDEDAELAQLGQLAGHVDLLLHQLE